MAGEGCEKILVVWEFVFGPGSAGVVCHFVYFSHLVLHVEGAGLVFSLNAGYGSEEAVGDFGHRFRFHAVFPGNCGLVIASEIGG